MLYLILRQKSQLDIAPPAIIKKQQQETDQRVKTESNRTTKNTLATQQNKKQFSDLLSKVEILQSIASKLTRVSDGLRSVKCSVADLSKSARCAALDIRRLKAESTKTASSLSRIFSTISSDRNIADIRHNSVSAVLIGNIFLNGDDADEQSATALNTAPAESVELNLQATIDWDRTNGVGTPVYEHHGLWPVGMHPKITVAKKGGMDVDIAAPLYRVKDSTMSSVGGTATWGLTAWQASTAYSQGDVVENTGNSGHTYICTTAGTSAGSGGPTTKETDIADGTAVWDYVGDGGIGVELTDSTGVSRGLALRRDDDGQLFEVTAVAENAVAVLKNPHGLSVPSGAGASSVGELPKFTEFGGLDLTLTLDTDEGVTKTYANGDELYLTVDVSGIDVTIKLASVESKTITIPIGT